MLKEQGAGKEEGLFLMVFSFPAPSWGAGPPPSLATLSSVARCRATMGRPVPGARRARGSGLLGWKRRSR